MKFSFDIKKESDVNIISLEGELIDKTQASGLLHSIDGLIEKGEGKFVFDLAGIQYLNSSGLNVLINVLTKSRKEGGDVIITNVSKKVNQLFLITKLNTIFTMAESKEAAISNFN